MKKNNKKGFTIVELVIVIAVIAILSAVLIPSFSGIIGNAQKTTAAQEARNMYTQYVSDHAASVGGIQDVVIIQSGSYYVVVRNGSAEVDDVFSGETALADAAEAAFGEDAKAVQITCDANPAHTNCASIYVKKTA